MPARPAARGRAVLAAAALVASAAAMAFDRPLPLPDAQRAFLDKGVVAYVHWGLGTYLSARETNNGSCPADRLAPDALAPAQWAQVLKEAGVALVVLVAKDSDGFCLWPSRTARAYSMRTLGAGLARRNLVAELEQACRRHALAFGVTLSFWDRRQASFGTGAYGKLFQTQWEEIFASLRGDLSYAGVGTALGGRGWYGGARGDRGESRYVKPSLVALAPLRDALATRHPQAVLAAPRGLGTVERRVGRPAASETWRYTQRASDGTARFVVQEVFLPLSSSLHHRPDEPVKPLEDLMTAYYETVGRGAVLALGVSPDRHGRLAAADVRRLREFGAAVRAFERSDYARGAMRGARVGGERERAVVAIFGGPRLVDAVDFAEDLSAGQTVSGWTVETDAPGGGWKRVAGGTSAGWRRIARFDPVTTTRVRLTCRGARPPAIVRFAVRKTPVTAGGGKACRE